MNERIRELAIEAGFDVEVQDIFNYKPQHSFIGIDENIERFAELIEQEVIQRIKDKKNPAYSDIVSDGGMDPRN
jgi:hypothetical protein